MGAFVEWMLMPLRRYFDFEGRSRRKEYWMFTLFYMLLLIVPMVLIVAGIEPGQDGPSVLTTVGVAVLGLIVLAFLIPSLAVQVRRFHDQDKSGWFVLMGFIPYVGGIIVLVFMCLEGTPGENRFGPDPKGPGERR